jgi:hypothetical protein
MMQYWTNGKLGDSMKACPQSCLTLLAHRWFVQFSRTAAIGLQQYECGYVDVGLGGGSPIQTLMRRAS